MAATDRLGAEQIFHDTQALERARDLGREPKRLRFADADYLDHETWIRPAFAQLGNLTGLDVLDYGCGHGMTAARCSASRGEKIPYSTWPEARFLTRASSARRMKSP